MVFLATCLLYIRLAQPRLPSKLGVLASPCPLPSSNDTSSFLYQIYACPYLVTLSPPSFSCHCLCPYNAKMPNIFKQKLDDTPREALNWKLWFAVFTFGLMG